MAPNLEEIQLSVNLPLACKNYVDRMRRQMASPNLLAKDVIRAATYRYQHFWLPLVARYPDEDLMGPEDVEWAWHCHMLNPVFYDRDCEMLVGRFIGNEALIRNNEENERALQESKRLWEETYPPEHPFFVDISDPVRPEYRDGETNFNTDFLAVAKRQMEFNYQATLPHYQDPQFIAAAVERYKRYLHLINTYPDHFVIPTFDVDFVWHSHQLCPLQYRVDTKDILGRELDHGKVPPGLPLDAKVLSPDQFTIDAWEKKFGDSISVFGGNYRGENPIGKLDAVVKEKLVLLTGDMKGTLTDDKLITRHNLDKEVTQHLPTALEKHNKMEIKATKTSLKSGVEITLLIQSGKEEELEMPESHKIMLWGPIPLLEPPLQTDCVRMNVVSYKLLSSQKQETFTCRLTTCRDLEMEAVEVFFCDKMVAVAHLTGDEQLPHPCQVSNTEVVPVVDSLRGEHAALIINSQGDWGVLVARMAEEKPLSGMNKSTPVKTYMDLTLWILGSDRKIEFRMPNESNEYKLSLDGVSVNISTGSVKIDELDTPVAECLAMAFMVKILWRLCTTRLSLGTELC